MAKYYIESYKKIEQSFLSGINSMNDLGNIVEPYEITLIKRFLFGILKSKCIKKIYLPVGFNHTKELKKGRVFNF